MNRKVIIFLIVLFIYIFLLKGYLNLLLATIIFAYFTEVFIEIFTYLKEKFLAFFESKEENYKKYNFLFSLLKKLNINIFFVYFFYLVSFIFLIFFIFIPVLNRVILVMMSILKKTPAFLDNLKSILLKYNVNIDFANLEKFIDFVVNGLIKFLGVIVSNLGDWVVLLLVPLLGIYFIDAKRDFLKWLEENFNNLIVEFFKIFDYYQKVYIKAILVNVLSIIVLSSIIFSFLFGLDGISYGVVYGLFSFVPIVGPLLGSLPVIVISFSKSVVDGVVVVVLVFLIQQISDNLVMPKTVERFMVITPFFSIISILAFYSLINFWAVFLAVPIALTLKNIIEKS